MQKEYEQMAEQFVKLWQEQVSGYLKDPAVMKATMDTWQNFSKMQEKQGGFADVSKSSININVDTLNNLLARLASCEQRIAKLESKLNSSSERKTSRCGEKTV